MKIRVVSQQWFKENTWNLGPLPVYQCPDSVFWKENNFISIRHSSETDPNCAIPVDGENILKLRFDDVTEAAKKTEIDGENAAEKPMSLLSIHRVYCDRILSGEKRYEFRKRCPEWMRPGCEMALFSSDSPETLLALFEVGEILSGSPEEIWQRTCARGIDYDAFMRYYENQTSAFAFAIRNVRRIADGKTVAALPGVDGVPHSFTRLSEKQAKTVRECARSVNYGDRGNDQKKDDDDSAADTADKLVFFDADIAGEIVRFIRKIDTSRLLFVNCGAGISRSGAVGEVLNDYFNKYLEFNALDDEYFRRLNRQIQGNPLVRRVLRETLFGKGFM